MSSPIKSLLPIVAPCKGSLMQTSTAYMFAFALPGGVRCNLGAISYG